MHCTNDPELIHLLLSNLPTACDGSEVLMIHTPAYADAVAQVLDAGEYPNVKPARISIDWAEASAAKQHYERQHAPRFRDTKPLTTKKARKAARRRQHAARKRAR